MIEGVLISKMNKHSKKLSFKKSSGINRKNRIKMKRKITLLLMALMVMTTAFSQTTRSKGEARIRGTVNGDWETITFDDKDYLYFLGNDQVDNTTINTHLLGHHWKGQDFTKFIGDSIYFCNVETGEYLQIGDLWGENGMTSHVGIPYKILEGTSTRQWGVLTSNDSRADMSNNTYWIQPLDVRQARTRSFVALGWRTWPI